MKMDEKDQKIRDLERQIEGMRQEIDVLRRGGPQFQRGAWPQGAQAFPYGQRPPARPKARPLRVVLIVVGSLTAIVVFAAALVFLMFTLLNEADKETTTMAEELLQAIVDQDEDRAYALIYPRTLPREEFEPIFAELCATWRDGGGGSAFTLKRTSWSMNSSGGISHCSSVYWVSSGEARFFLEVERKAAGETTGLTGAQLSR